MKKLTKKRLALLLALIAAAGAFSGCGRSDGEDEDDGNYIEGSTVISGEVLTAGKAADNVFSLCADYSESVSAGPDTTIPKNKTLNPITTQNSLNQMVDCLVYDRLFEVDDNFNLTSRILSDWYYVDSGELGVWVLTLKDNIPMHDGSTMTAADVIYSVSRVFSQGATYYQKQLGTVYSSGSDNMIYLAGNFSNAMMLYRMTVPIIKSGSILENTPAGSGPYKFNFDGDNAYLEKFEDYEGAENLPLDKIYLQQYTDSENMISDYESALVDLVVNDPSSIYNMGYGGKNEKRVYNTCNMQYVGFSSASEFFGYDQYRTVITYLIDRESIVDDVLDGNGVPTAIPIHPNSSVFDASFNEALSYNPAKAREELEKLGCRDLDEDGMLEYALSGAKKEIYIDFVVCADNARKVQAAKRIVQAMEEAGIPVTLKELSWADYNTALKEGEFDMYYAETVIPADWNTLPLFETLEDEENVTNLNYGRWTRKDAENAVYAYLAAKDEDRPAAVQTMLQTLSTNAMFLPVCFEKQEVLSHLGIIKGMMPNQYNIFHGITDWTIALNG